MFRLKPRKKCTFITLEASEIRQGTVKTQCLVSAHLQCRSKSRCGLKKESNDLYIGGQKISILETKESHCVPGSSCFPSGFYLSLHC